VSKVSRKAPNKLSSTLSYTSLASATADDHFFRRCLYVGLFFFLVVALVIPIIDLPKKSRAEQEKLPPRMTQLKMKPKPKPAPQLVKEKIEKKVEKKVEPPQVANKPKPQPSKKTEPKPVPEPKPIETSIAQKPKAKPMSEARQQARAEAEQSGVLAMKNQLAGLQSLTQVPVDRKSIGKMSKQDSARPQAQQQLANLAKGSSGGKAAAQAVTSASGTQGLAHTTQSVDSKVLAQGKRLESQDTVVANTLSTSGQVTRDEHAIRQIFEKNKSSIYSLYARAQRRNEGLAGKVVLEIKIGASGKVEGLTLVDSELSDELLVKKIMTRVKMFDFGADNVASVTMQYTFDFVSS